MQKNLTSLLHNEILNEKNNKYNLRDYFLGLGYKDNLDKESSIARAYAFSSLINNSKKHIYKNDIILGSLKGLFSETLPDDYEYIVNFTNIYGERGFLQGRDHYASAYEKLLNLGIKGIKREIIESRQKYIKDNKKISFLDSCELSINAFTEMIKGYADIADNKDIKKLCNNITSEPPKTFNEALQLIWFAHLAYLYQGLFAMAFGRIDQYLYKFYKSDIEKGILTYESAVLLLENTFIKIKEFRQFNSFDDVVNICIGGEDEYGNNAVNELSFAVLEAVKNCKIPGPNLSARISNKNPESFLNNCIKVIGTGIGYPALMNDSVNIKAMERLGYKKEDAQNYCMVGCIENFIAGKQPPWADDRFDVPKFLEYTLNNGKSFLNDKIEGINTGSACNLKNMKEFMTAFEKQIENSAKYYAARIINENNRYNNDNYSNPFMSCLSYNCIQIGKDIYNGGSEYPSVHGVGCMGIATVADSLAAIETTVYTDKSIKMEELINALKNNFNGYEDIRIKLLKAPKYGNNCEVADKYAEWYVNFISKIFEKFSLADGGKFTIGIASNISNISAGLNCSATPDGRYARQPLSDAASPTYGKDINGVTIALNSLCKPEYVQAGLGTVVNQKFSPKMFEGEDNIARLASLVEVYFKNGGQEIQINSVSRDMLIDAMNNPENYGNLVVRVSGFSAYYTTLDKSIQSDILNRTEH
jgi:formate C-acetyltransferase